MSEPAAPHHAERVRSTPAAPTSTARASADSINWQQPLLSAGQVLRLQRAIGNSATMAAIRRVQRQPTPTTSIGVSGVKLSASKVSVPPESGLNLRASAQPSKATGVQFSIQKGTVSPSGVSIDASTGVITVSAGQSGGTVTIKATADDGSWATTDLRLIEKPTALSSTSASSQGGSVYGGKFTHTFTDASGTPSGLQGENINEKFDTLSAATPFGPFSLTANAAGSHGWDLDSTGTMAGPDNVTVDKSLVDVGKVVKSASNPSPKQGLPVTWTMTQHMKAKSFPSGNMDASAFTDIDHVRTLTSSETFMVTAGTQNVEDPYTGPTAYTNAKASPSSVDASPPKPKSGSWAQNKVQVDCDVIPSSGSKVFSIVGAALGCKVDKSTGELLIGSTPGTITVRISSGPGGKNFDEVTVTISKPAPPAPATPTPTPSP